MDMNGLMPLLMAYAFVPTSKGISLIGSASSAVLGQSFRFTCTVPVPSTGQLLVFKRDNRDVCTVSLNLCQQFSAPPGYTCSCGQSGVYNMDITSVSKKDEGRWECGLSQTSNNITLPVYYLDSPNITLNKQNVMENDSVTVTCTVESNPPATMTLEYGNIERFTNTTNNIMYKIERVQCPHNVPFNCTTKNKQTETVTSKMAQLNVTCSPRPVSCTVVSEKRMHFACLRANVTANPLPNFTWFKHSSRQMLVVNGTGSLILSSGLSSNLTVLIKSEDDYTNYSVVVENSLGNTTLFCNLTGGLSTVPKSTVPKEDIIPAVAGVGAAAVVILIIVIIVILHRRGVLKLKGNSNKKDCPTQQDERARVIDNVYLEGDDGLKYGRDEDGLMYVGIVFDNQATPTAAPERMEEATEYAGIAHGVVGCPPPPDEEDEKK